MSRRVLVADDSATIQKVIKIAFSRHELEIVEAASLIESLAAVTRAKVDALIIDASLPGARGPADLAKLRADAGDVSVLLLVGTYDSVDEDAFRKAGFTQFLKKPFESQDIVQAVDAMLGAGPTGEPEPTPPPPHGRPQHPTMIVTGGAYKDQADGDDGEAPPPPPPATDQTRKGRRAFGEGEDTAPSRAGGGSDEATDPRRGSAQRAPSPLPPIPPSAGMGSGLSMALDPAAFPVAGDVASTRGIQPEGLAALVDQHLPALVRQAVEEYCERHFKSLAREIIAAELRRLADEKARHLVDN